MSKGRSIQYNYNLFLKEQSTQHLATQVKKNTHAIHKRRKNDLAKTIKGCKLKKQNVELEYML